MKMNGPIIITVPNNYLKVENVESKSPSPSRKRRLDHLSWEEKMQRKKLKNRVAAQTSRDRKKAKMDEMEEQIMKLMKSNEHIVNEMSNLKAINERLLDENEKLKREATACSVAGAPGSAVSAPRQKEGAPPAIRAARLLLTMCLLSQTSSLTLNHLNISTLCNNSQTPSFKKLVQIVQEKIKLSQTGNLQNALKELKWWGPQQSSWNPMEVES